MTVDWGLYLVTDPGMSDRRVVDVVADAVAGGVSVVQLRDKVSSDEELEATAREVLDVVGPQVPLFINDRVEVARRVGCHLHLGQDDMPLARARKILGPEPMIGLSIGSHAEFDRLLGCAPPFPSVVGIGPVFDTSTKADAPAGLGLPLATELASRAQEVGIPAVAIGGIQEANAGGFSGSSWDGICVVSAIMAAPDPRTAAHQLREASTL